MQQGEEQSLVALYAEACAIGEELLSLLNGPSPAGALDHVTGLLEARHRIAELTGPLAARGGVSPDALPLLQQIVEQQPAIDSGFRSALAELQSQQLAAIMQHGKVRGAQNLLATGPRSRLLNEYR